MLGFAPDLPVTTEGILVDCFEMIPSETGMKAGPQPEVYSDALVAECRGAEVLTKLDGSRRVFAGTASKLYELSGTAWNDVSRAGDYTLGADTRWSFTQFGDTSIAANIDSVIQTSTAGAFANQATAPQATIVEAVLSSGGGFVFAFNTIDGTYGTSPDRWWCSAVNDVTSWTPNVTTQATTGRLLGTEGKITAALKFGADRIVAYKARSLYAGTYVGPPTAWAWQEYPGYGCVGQNAIANLGTAHFVVGEDNFYIFDGSAPRPVDARLRRWFYANSSGTARHLTTVVYDRETDLVWVFYPSLSSTYLDRALVYHLKSGKWGKYDQLEVETALLFNTPSATFDSDSGTFDDAEGTFDSAAPGNLILATFDTSHRLTTMSGEPGYSTMTTQDIGDDTMVTRLVEARLRYEVTPTGAYCTGVSSMATGGTRYAFTQEDAYELLDYSQAKNVFPLRQTGRFHRLAFVFTGNVDVTAYEAKLVPAGSR